MQQPCITKYVPYAPDIYIFKKLRSTDQGYMPTKPQDANVWPCGCVAAVKDRLAGWCLGGRYSVSWPLGPSPPTRCDCVLCIAAVEVESVVDRPSQDVAGWLGAFVSLVEQAALSLQHAMQAPQLRDANFPGAHFPTGKSRRTASSVNVDCNTLSRGLQYCNH